MYKRQDELILSVIEIVNHPDYDQKKGPSHGGDIAVFKVDEKPIWKKGLERKKLYPACLPRPSYSYSRSIIAGWRDPEPTYRRTDRRDDSVAAYRDEQHLQHSRMVEVNCSDPIWMRSNTAYPPGTVCYRLEVLLFAFLALLK